MADRQRSGSILTDIPSLEGSHQELKDNTTIVGERFCPAIAYGPPRVLANPS